MNDMNHIRDTLFDYEFIELLHYAIASIIVKSKLTNIATEIVDHDILLFDCSFPNELMDDWSSMRMQQKIWEVPLNFLEDSFGNGFVSRFELNSNEVQTRVANQKFSQAAWNVAAGIFSVILIKLSLCWNEISFNNPVSELLTDLL